MAITKTCYNSWWNLFVLTGSSEDDSASEREGWQSSRSRSGSRHSKYNGNSKYCLKHYILRINREHFLDTSIYFCCLKLAWFCILCILSIAFCNVVVRFSVLCLFLLRRLFVCLFICLFICLFLSFFVSLFLWLSV